MHTKPDLPLVSVIIPLYNASKYIEQTLTSVVNQTYQNIEIIVIDHASSDNSLAKLEEMSDSIHNLSIIRCDENKGGPAFPRNIGINASKGDYIAFLDSDDVWENNKIEMQINVAIQDKYNFICSKAILIDGESYPIQKSFYKYKRKKDITINQLLYRNQIITSSVMIKRTLLSGLNFNEDEELITCEDLHLWLQIINTDFCKPVMLQQNLLKLRVISTSLGSVSGRVIFAVKYLFASMKFLIRTNNIKLVYISIVSFMLRVIKIKLSTIFNNKNKMIKFNNLKKDLPYTLLYQNYNEAINAGQKNIEAISISSFDNQINEVDSRFVNLKIVDNDNFIFFSNYNSPKSQQFLKHNQISAILYWPSIGTQIRMKAIIKRTSTAFNKKYFLNRSSEKNALAISSKQSSPIEHYEDVIRNHANSLKSDNTKDCPEYWGGFTFTPYYFEFWHGHVSRINKREVFKRVSNDWAYSILQP